MKHRLVEFFESDHGQLSMTRLLCFLSFFPASYCLIASAGTETVGEIMAWYLGAFVLGYVGGKFADVKTGIEGKNVQSNSVPAPE